MKEINVNSIVKVKLNDIGKLMLNDFYQKVDRMNLTGYGIKPEPDEKGYYSFPLHTLMHIFGPYATVDKDTFPFEPFIVVKPFDIQEHSDRPTRTRRGKK